MLYKIQLSRDELSVIFCYENINYSFLYFRLILEKNTPYICLRILILYMYLSIYIQKHEFHYILFFSILFYHFFFYKYFFFKRRPPAQCEAPSRRARGRGSLTPPLSSTLTWLSWAVGVWARSGEPSWAASVIMWFIMLMYLLWCVRHLDFECGINSWLGICTCMWISPVFFFRTWQSTVEYLLMNCTHV